MPIMYKSKLIIKVLSIIIFTLLVYKPIFASFTISDNANVTITAIVGSTPGSSPGSGGSNDYSFRTTVNSSGFAYPNATVHVLKDGVPKASKVADGDGSFSIDLDEPYSKDAL